MTSRPLLTFAFLTGFLTSAGADEASERYERAIRREVEYARRAAQRVVQPGESERARWYKRLDEVYTGKVPEDAGRWFNLVAVGNGGLWTRDGSKYFAELHKRVCERLELDETEPIGRVEFIAYARAFLGQDSPPWRILDLADEARRPFRSFDADRDGLLTPWECPTNLRDRFATYDRNGNGRLEPAEYGAYFRSRVEDEVDSAPPPKDQSEADVRRLMTLSAEERQEAVEKRMTRPLVYREPSLLPKGIPDWFREYDQDQDLQIGLYEWRAAEGPLDRFTAMDLNGDGLLEVSEYLRYVKRQEEDGSPLEDDGPPMPGGRAATTTKMSATKGGSSK